MISWFKKLWRDKRGNAIIIMGAALPMVIGAAGLASDTIQWTLWKRQLQRAADSAAIAGVYTRYATGATTKVPSAIAHDIDLNDHTWMSLMSGYPQITYPANSGVKTNQVQVTLKIQQRLPFSSLFMSAAPIITATSTAATVPAGGSACFEALETANTTGLNFSGNAGIEAPDCDGFSNSGGSNASIARGSSDVTLNSVGGVGGVQNSNNFHVTSYRPYSPALADPFSQVNPDFSQMKCNVGQTTTTTTGHGANQVTTTSTTYGSYDLTDADNGNIANLKISDGTQANCFHSISVASNTTLTLPSGTYYINGGDLTVQGTLNCTSCTFVLTNKDASSPIGNIKNNGNPASKMNITAPSDSTNPYKGIAIYQDRRAPDCNVCNKINGNNASIIQGAIYLPSQELEYNGTGTTSAICTMFVARRLNFSGNSTTTNKFSKLDNCSFVGLGGSSSYVMVRLVG
jgi:Flp pilus assembly protein TadG